ncbi:MAG TPA: FUSC family protein [Arachnia sp.]|nr:FUSC family protein [Arachnia sp.]HMT86498.1 FUSC family protein [Arachnia sp.]
MSSLAQSGWAIPRPVLKLSTSITLAMVLVFVAVLLFVDVFAAVGVGMGALSSARPVTALRPRHAIALALPSALAGAVAIGVRGDPFATACFVALCCVIVAAADRHQEGLLAGMPCVVTVLVSIPGAYDPAWIAAWMVVGSLVTAGIAVLLKVPPAASPGVSASLAWRHGIVMATSAGVVMYLVQYFGIPHGYWIVVTLTVVLRPMIDHTKARARQRVIGTVGGVFLSLLLVQTVPPWAVGIVLVACFLLMTSYSILKDYARQVVFLTPAVLLIAPTGGVGTVASERALATIVGTVLAGALALIVGRLDSRPAEPPGAVTRSAG